MSQKRKGQKSGLYRASLTLRCYALSPSGLPFQSLTQSLGFQFSYSHKAAPVSENIGDVVT
ncbi:MAG: hypothetical protein NZ551_03025 [Microscillaceae bacterium]|nr:hypothetical protein [Microscillaceae bacterium]MDW8460161.1 hypothetical protein [Cytophagales bacterium]